MSEQFKQFNASETGQEKPELMALIQKIQQHLMFLEKKLDTLISQSAEKPAFNKGRHFSRPFRPGGPSHHSGPRDRGREHGHHSQDRNFSQERSFNHPRGEQKPEFGQRRKPFFSRRKDHR